MHLRLVRIIISIGVELGLPVDLTPFILLLLAQIKLLPSNILDKLILLVLLSPGVFVELELTLSGPNNQKLRNDTAGENGYAADDGKSCSPCGIRQKILIIDLLTRDELLFISNIRIFLLLILHKVNDFGLTQILLL